MSKASAGKVTQPRIRARARLRPKAQLTLPEEIRRALHVSEGEEIEFAVHEDGMITVRGFVSVPTDQAWCSPPGRRADKRQAGVETGALEGAVHRSAEAMFAHLDSLGTTDDLWQRLRRFPSSS